MNEGCIQDPSGIPYLCGQDIPEGLDAMNRTVASPFPLADGFLVAIQVARQRTAVAGSTWVIAPSGICRNRLPTSRNASGSPLQANR